MEQSCIKRCQQQYHIITIIVESLGRKRIESVHNYMHLHAICVIPIFSAVISKYTIECFVYGVEKHKFRKKNNVVGQE
ncbi:hypothetical protein EXN66_Car008669 [Channa argus]|uniref:Uncharacterized protein n=1 Tax=Channa argus TaxID=215402 RepID=A0A6G1PS32_CHAAH|nr:hypothetical protein EXN66_Car008669 [Channa argus]